jgi:hypothetical protein
LSAVRAALGEPTFAATWEAGRAMSLADAVSYALQHNDVSSGEGE